MKYEEAIKKIDFLIGGYQMLIDENIGNGDVVGHDVRGTWEADISCIDAYKDLINACETAKQALEKQIPKKPKNQRLAEGILGDNGIYAGNCPSCEENVIGNYYGEYCGNCGQKLDWSEVYD